MVIAEETKLHLQQQRLTFDGVQHSVVQRFPTGIVGRGADAGSTAVSQSAPEQRIKNKLHHVNRTSKGGILRQTNIDLQE